MNPSQPNPQDPNRPIQSSDPMDEAEGLLEPTPESFPPQPPVPRLPPSGAMPKAPPPAPLPAPDPIEPPGWATILGGKLVAAFVGVLGVASIAAMAFACWWLYRKAFTP